MAPAPVKRRGHRLRVTALAVGLIVAPTAAMATYAVIDTKNLAEAAKQLSALKEQISLIKQEVENSLQILSVLNDVSTFVQDTVNAIGEVGQITVPFTTMAKLAGQIQRDATCLMPDLSEIMPNVDLDDLDLTSVCGARKAYANTLWFDPARAAGMDWAEQEEARREVIQRRARVLRTAAVDALAHADVQTAAAAEQSDRAVRELESAAKAAKDLNSRMAVGNQALLLIARQQATQTQLLASLLKIQGATATMSMVDQDPMSDEDAPEAPEGAQ
ncbi:hypothetical protein [Caenispirillum bisanense]|uniref:Type IV secretion system protein n=1 Tax=Caenispirillum bisanense TaxID=414052 RepID=A0A286GT14_9PROT|nr:hypothetical protein [Caenispirillum bisanense]SOD98602.1 hypothetical protein SAMN05421508_10823 [Caenispirillum bisanense]